MKTDNSRSISKTFMKRRTRVSRVRVFSYFRYRDSRWFARIVVLELSRPRSFEPSMRRNFILKQEIHAVRKEKMIVIDKKKKDEKIIEIKRRRK